MTKLTTSVYTGRVRRFLSAWWPEILLAAATLFFVFRELGTFPEIWTDEGLFVLMARSVANGHGYALPVFNFYWPFPNIVTAGPLLVVPVAASIKLFGFSMTAARLPMALYLLGSSAAFYFLCRKIDGVWSARFGTALLVTFSGFINTGKPVLGEIPGYFFFLLGLLALVSGTDRRHAVWAGVAFGLSVVTKLTFGLVFPAFIVAWLLSALLRKKEELVRWTIVGCCAFAVFAWWPLLLTLHGNIAKEVQLSFLAEGGKTLLYPLFHYSGDFLRFPFLIFDALLIVACFGFTHTAQRQRSTIVAFVLTFVLLNIMHVLSVPYPPWYRYFLPAHLAFLPFVPSGLRTLVRHKKTASALLLCMIAMQGWWQLTYRGATRGNEVQQASDALVRDYANERLVVVNSELYALLPQDHPGWYFVTTELTRRTYDAFPQFPTRQERHCLPEVRKLSDEDVALLPAGRVRTVFGRYRLILAAPGCVAEPLAESPVK